VELSGGGVDFGVAELQLDCAGGVDDYGIRFWGEHGSGGVHDLSGGAGLGWDGEQRRWGSYSIPLASGTNFYGQVAGSANVVGGMLCESKSRRRRRGAGRMQRGMVATVTYQMQTRAEVRGSIAEVGSSPRDLGYLAAVRVVQATP